MPPEPTYYLSKMNRTLRISLLTFTTVIAAASFAQTTLTPDVKTGLLNTLTQRVTQFAFVPGKDFSTFPSILTQFQPKIEAASTTGEFASVLNEALGKLGVSHMNVITPEAAQARQTGGTVGIGIQLEMTEKGIKLLAVYPKSPAAVGGLNVGDTIILINGAKPKSREDLAGPAGTTFNLSVEAPDGKVREAKVTKAFFSTREPESVTWKKDTAILRIPTFDGFAQPGKTPTGYDSSNVQKLFTEIQPKAKYLIIDLRNNPGGVVMNMLAFAGYFIPREQAMGSFVNRSTSAQFVKETGSKPDDLKAFSAWDKSPIRPLPQSTRYTGPIAVLISGGTGSAAEMMAAALRDTVGARVFGQKSIGMVLASVITPLDPIGTPREKRTGFQMIVPIQDYITVKGLRIEGNGVVPDVPVTGQVTAEKDPVIDAAMAWIATKPKPKI